MGKRSGGLGLLACSCVLALGYAFTVLDEGWIGYDFAGTLWAPGRAVLEGATPYPIESLAGSPSVHPPPVILAFVPLALLPFGVAALLMSALLLAAAGAAVRVLELQDWFVYAAVLSSFAVVSASSWGNTAPLMVLFVALAWRDRRRSWLWVAAAILVKLWIAPLLLWLAFTRVRHALLAVLAVLGALAVSWGAIGGDGLMDYPARLSGLEQAQSDQGILLYALILKLSGSAGIATSVTVAAAILICAVARSVDERRMFQLVVVACLVASPIMWASYLALLVVLVGVSEHRNDRVVWLALPATWLLALPSAGDPRPGLLVAGVAGFMALITFIALDLSGRAPASRVVRQLPSPEPSLNA